MKGILLDYLNKYIELVKNMNGGKQLSIEEFILNNGKEFSENGGKVKKYEYGKMKECYKNAFLLMVGRKELYYCEGFATFPNLPLPVLHAWCIDKKGRVYDPTWKDGDEYYGVVFDRKFAFSRVMKNGCGIIDDWKHRWPLLTGKEKKGWRAKI